MEKISLATGSLGNNPITEEVLKKSIARVDIKKLMVYESPLGMVKLRKILARIYGGNIDEDNIMITSSSQQALVIIMNYLAKEKQKMFIQEPAYFGILRLAKNKDITTFEAFRDLQKIKNHLSFSVIYLTSNYSALAGSMADWEKRKIAELSRTSEVTIIEDNPYDLIHFEESRPGSIFELALENTIYVGGFSKILSPGLRIGYIISSKKIIRVLKSEKINQDIFTPTLGQQVCLEALKGSEYLKELRYYFKAKRDLATKLLDFYFKDDPRLTWNMPRGGIFITIKITKEIPTDKLITTAKEKFNLILEKDKYSYFDGRSRNTLRINFVQNSDALLKDAVGRLFKLIKEV